MSDAEATLQAALITAVASLVVAVLGTIVSFLSQKRIARLEADLSERTAQRNARLEYEFEARKRLYQECEPLLFELSELAERALGRIVGLARTAANGDLDPGPTSWLRRGYYQRSTYYRLIAPLAVGKLISSRLTNLDLALDGSIRWQYALCKLLVDTFTDDFDIARHSPALEYRPHEKVSESARTEKPDVYWQQGIPRGILENAVASLLVDQPGGERRLMSFSEFESRLNANDEPLAGSFGRIDYLFQDFHPATRPVLWRVLLAQAYLYQLLLLAHEGELKELPGSEDWADPRANFDWRGNANSVGNAPVDLPIQAVPVYVRLRTRPILDKVKKQKQGGSTL